MAEESTDATAVADTSTTDTQNAEANLENDDTSFEDFDDQDEARESEINGEADTEQPDEQEESEDDETTDETEESEDVSDDTEEAPEVKDEDVKARNKEAAERRVREKQQRELDQKQQQDKYLNEADDDKDLALRQVQVAQYNLEVKSNTADLTNDYNKAYNEFEILRSNDPVIQKEVNDAIDTFQATKVTIDAYGNPTDVRGSLYEYLQSKAESIEKLTGIGAKRQTTAKQKEQSKTFTKPTTAPKQPKTDPMLDAFDEEANS